MVTLGLAPQRSAAGSDYPKLGTVQRLDSRLDSLIAPGTEMERIAEGFEWIEGPVWVTKDRMLLFSDIPHNIVYKWKDGDKKATKFLQPSGYTGKAERGGEPGSNGLLLDSQGRLVLCQHGDRRIARLRPDGAFETLVDRFEGKRFNSPNDAVFSREGDLYFTDPPYGLLMLNEDPTKELPFNGVYRLSKSGELSLLTKEMSYPNGIGLSPDERTLYVANSDPKKAIWMAYDLQDGKISGGRVFFDATELVKTAKGLPDGLVVDRDGNLFATGPGGVLVFAPDGTHLGTLNTGEATANCTFDDGETLYITADMYLCRIATLTGARRQP